MIGTCEKNYYDVSMLFVKIMKNFNTKRKNIFIKEVMAIVEKQRKKGYFSSFERFCRKETI
jgi:hypothetical protein